MCRIGLRRAAVSMAVVVVLLASCSRPPLRIGYTPWPANEPISLAESMSTLPKDVRLSRLSSTNDLLLAFGAGQLEMVVISATNTLRLAANRIPLVAVAPLNTSCGADGIVASPLATAVPIAGTKVATSRHDDNNYLLFRFAGNLNPSTVFQLHQLDTDSLVGDAFDRGEFQVACLSDPRLLALEDGGATLLRSSRDYPNELISFLVVKRDTLALRRNEIERILRFWYPWIARVKDSHELATAVAGENGLDLPTARRVLARTSFPTEVEALQILQDKAPAWFVPTRQYLATVGVTTVPLVEDVVAPELLARFVRAAR
jgi:ABC-type nitrate/sulfonate/bicarbonate transport system substrate-binding protein